GLVVVLTGATGFLGRRLLRAMVESPAIKIIYCIAVRDPSKLSDFSSAYKVVIHAGDLRSPLLGLNSNDAQSIFTSADLIIHNGADVSFLKPYTTLKTTNVASTKELVRLIHTYPSTSTSTSGPALHFVSTAGVAALTNNQQDLYERRLLGQPVGSSNTSEYVASKWACETFLENVSAADTGLCIVVHRPTAIVGPDAPRLDVMHNVINLADQLRCVPQMRALEGWFQFVPIEEITRDILDDILGNPSGGYAVPDDTLGPRIRYYNHYGPDEETVEIHDLGEYLGKKQGVQFETVEDYEWVRRANAIGVAAEIMEYLLTIGENFEKTGAKWIFPRVWKSLNVLKSD
ncbi:male sterility protein-domain-containing protein, partial [Diaporthe sp. PMI_573]